MGNEGVFELGLLDVKNQPAQDPKTKVSFFRVSDNREILQARDLEFPPVRRFRLPAFPQEKNLVCETTPSRFRQGKTDIFTITDSKVTRRNPVVLRLPDEWTPQFVPWNLLSGEFLELQDVLDRSPGIRVKKGQSFDKLTEAVYDSVTGDKAVLAKMALLNLYAALTITKEPTTGTASWFSFVRQIFLIDRERFIALVDPKMGEIIRAIKDNISAFPDYKHTPSANHHEGVQDAVPEGFKVVKSKMFSVKTREENANIQLTIAPTKDLNGNQVIVLDVDIDENNNLLKHLGDLIRHIITGGTHPIDIHEFLVLAHPNIALGYNLI
jgi:hypothetical protein